MGDAVTDLNSLFKEIYKDKLASLMPNGLPLLDKELIKREEERRKKLQMSKEFDKAVKEIVNE